MPLICRTRNKPPLARIFALVALLCAGALQVQEAGHDHWSSIDDSYSQCLVCKAGTAIPTSGASVDQVVSTGIVVRAQPTQSTLAPASTAFDARGPPFNS
ncbi:hypothetical protein E2F43_04635 [Seongchinamella unica]|uniref:Uncharacterized protein n=1 Tax=Seongchinamella unica TaxID=2547392 RepID=A0A4R5LVU0_9GAMM|nr:hypothetical protein [Seongchinamella unica]TDG15521.1 hypothetical protein E2F43_04635 [Seongchinamella unica]